MNLNTFAGALNSFATPHLALAKRERGGPCPTKTITFTSSEHEGLYQLTECQQFTDGSYGAISGKCHTVQVPDPASNTALNITTSFYDNTSVIRGSPVGYNASLVGCAVSAGTAHSTHQDNTILIAVLAVVGGIALSAMLCCCAPKIHRCRKNRKRDREAQAARQAYELRQRQPVLETV